MITRSVALQQRLVHEMMAHAGSLSALIYYDGVMPSTCSEVANGVRVGAMGLPEDFFRAILYGQEPSLPEGCTYWRVVSDDGETMLQGDCQ